MKIDLSQQTDMEYKPTLHDVHAILDQEIVGEERSRMSLFTNFVLADKFVLMSGPRASGKTWISDHIREYFLGDIENGTGTAFSLSMGSKKSAWYQLDKINRASHIFIFELNQMPEGFEEVLKLWGEGKDASYKVTANTGGGFQVQDMTLKYKPTVFCLADEQEMKVGEQLLSRLTTIRTDSSVNQNKRVMNHQAVLAKKKKNPKKIDQETLNKLRMHVTTLPLFNSIDFKHPTAELFVESIPPFFTDCRRDFPKYLDNTYGIARFYWKERIRIDKGSENSLLFVTPADMFLNHIIYGRNLVESALRCSPVQKDIIEIVKTFGKPITRAAVQRNMRKIGYNISGHMCARHLNELADIGYLEKEKKSKDTNYEVGDLFNEFQFTVDWKEIIKATKDNITKEFPELAEAYIKKYCTPPINVVHPFSGKVVDISQLEIQKLDLAESRKDLSAFIQDDKDRTKAKELKSKKKEEDSMEIIEEEQPEYEEVDMRDIEVSN